MGEERKDKEERETEIGGQVKMNKRNGTLNGPRIETRFSFVNSYKKSNTDLVSMAPCNN